MRDIVDVPFFLRLGGRMRGPAGTPVGELRRVLISNVIVSNCASRQDTIITGITGHYIENIRLNNIIVLHQGWATQEDAALDTTHLAEIYHVHTHFGTYMVH